MNVTSGMTNPLSGPGTRCLDGTLGNPTLRESPSGLASATSRPPAARARGGKPKPKCRVAVLSLVAGAALLGCSSLPSEPWRVVPTFRLDVGGANGNTAQGYLALARRYESEGRLEQALEAYRKAGLTALDDADVQNTVGVALALHAQSAPAVMAMRRAVALAPDRAPLLNNLGYALMLDGRAEEARAIFRLTLAMEPTYGRALRNLAHLDLKTADAAARAAKPMAVAEVAAMPAAPAESAVPGLPVVSAAAMMAAATAQPTAAAAPEAVPASPPAAPTATATAATQTPVVTDPPLDGVSVEIINGNGINGAAARMRQLLRERDIAVGRLANRLPYDSPYTRVFYRPGKLAAAQQLAQSMPVDAEVLPAPENSTRADLSVLLGHDVRRSASCALFTACAAPGRHVSSAE